MNWFGIIKQPELKPASKITTNLGSKTEEEDDDCRRKYQEYINKIESMSGPHMQVKVDNYRLEDFTEEELCAILKDISMIDKNKMVYTQQGYSANVFNKAHIIERMDYYPNGYVELRHRLVTDKFYNNFRDLMYRNSVDFMWLYTGSKRLGGDFPPETSVIISVDVAKLSPGINWFNEDVNKAISMVEFR
tara:strand:+ start:685 stop:1254 length:570 start_codon:yes stop_codon:yes gene_type:complete